MMTMLERKLRIERLRIEVYAQGGDWDALREVTIRWPVRIEDAWRPISMYLYSGLSPWPGSQAEGVLADYLRFTEED